MSHNLMDDVVMNLDLNQEPVDQPAGPFSQFGSVINELETTHDWIYERFRHLEAVVEALTARARQRQSPRQARNSFDHAHVSIEQTNNVDSEGGEKRRVIESSIERGKGFKMVSTRLLAKALEMDVMVKKVDKEGGSFYDCNICLKMAREPILTRCGHLYCWLCFYKVPYVDSTARECPVCEGEVIDANIIPIYVNGNCARVSVSESESDSGFAVPPRPKAQRVESVRQERITRGLSHIPVAGALRQIRISIGTVGDHLQGTPEHESLNQDPQIAQTTDSLRQQSHQFSRVFPESVASLPTLSLTLNNQERIADEIETYLGSRLLQRRRLHLLSTDDRDPFTTNDAAEQSDDLWALDPADIFSPSRTDDVSDAAIEQENPVISTSPGTNLPEIHSSTSSRRRSRTSRLSDADRGNFHRSRRRRLI